MIKLLMASLLFLQAPTIIHGTVTLSATASDITPDPNDTECGVAYVQFFNGATAISPQIAAPDADGTYRFTLDTKTLTNGNYTFIAKAADKAGSNGVCDGSAPNVGASMPLSISIVNIPQDTTAPTVTINIQAQSVTINFVPKP